MQQEMRRNLSIIGAPFAGGQPKQGVEKGPTALRASGIVSRLRLDCGVEVVYDNDAVIAVDTTITSPTQTPLSPGAESRRNAKNAEQVSSLCHKLHNDVKQQAASSRCLVLGGDHSIAVGSISGILQQRPETYVVWVDAHADINTPESSPSGNIHGMPVAMLTRLMEPISQFDWLQKTNPLPSSNIAYIGLRDLDDGEVELIKNKQITAFFMTDVRALGISEVLRRVLQLAGNKTIHLSFDVDGIDPTYTPATGTPVQEGLSLDDALYICKTLSETDRLLSVDLVEVNPSLGNEEDVQKTCDNTIRLATTCFSPLPVSSRI